MNEFDYLNPIARAAGKVGKGVSIEVKVFRYGAQCVWNPAMPTRLTERQQARYDAIMRQAMDQAAEKLGGAVLYVRP